MNGATYSCLIYLKNGNQTQKKAFKIIQDLKIFEILSDYDPILIGTVPIDIDIPSSDLDIICYSSDLETFSRHLTSHFGSLNDFKIYTCEVSREPSLVCCFQTNLFPIEIFAQNIHSKNQHGYRHMLLQARLLNLAPVTIREHIRKLKLEGFKTEPAFAKYFELPGEPYSALLKLETFSDEDLKKIINSSQNSENKVA